MVSFSGDTCDRCRGMLAEENDGEIICMECGIVYRTVDEAEDEWWDQDE